MILIAPFKLLINNLLKNKNNISLIFGGANESAIKIIERFDINNIKLYITTDDGSVGDKCNCVDKTKELLKENKYAKMVLWQLTQNNNLFKVKC